MTFDSSKTFFFFFLLLLLQLQLIPVCARNNRNIRYLPFYLMKNPLFFIFYWYIFSEISPKLYAIHISRVIYNKQLMLCFVLCVCILYICRRQSRRSPTRVQTRRPPPPKDRSTDRRFCTIATPSATLLAVTARVPRSASAVETLSLTSKTTINIYLYNMSYYFNAYNIVILLLFKCHVNQLADGRFPFYNRREILYFNSLWELYYYRMTIIHTDTRQCDDVTFMTTIYIYIYIIYCYTTFLVFVCANSV